MLRRLFPASEAELVLDTLRFSVAGLNRRARLWLGSHHRSPNLTLMSTITLIASDDPDGLASVRPDMGSAGQASIVQMDVT